MDSVTTGGLTFAGFVDVQAKERRDREEEHQKVCYDIEDAICHMHVKDIDMHISDTLPRPGTGYGRPRENYELLAVSCARRKSVERKQKLRKTHKIDNHGENNGDG